MYLVLSSDSWIILEKKWTRILVFVVKVGVLYFVAVFYLVFINWKYIL